MWLATNNKLHSTVHATIFDDDLSTINQHDIVVDPAEYIVATGHRALVWRTALKGCSGVLTNGVLCASELGWASNIPLFQNLGVGTEFCLSEGAVVATHAPTNYVYFSSAPI